ncbi:MAG: hypothetical protein J0H06_00090 [Actinobacteria bacterium]|nr:hypothetical protein [Actinomycetota bacterium]
MRRLLTLAALLAIAGSALALTAGIAVAKTARPNCRVLLPMAKVEEVLGGEVTLQHSGPSDFIRNALTPGTEAGTECVYGTTEETANDYGFVGTVSTAFAETPKQWNGYRASAKAYPGLEATTFQPVKLGGGNNSFVLHSDGSGAGEPDVYYLYVYTPLHNIFSIDFLNGVTLKTEEGLAREVSKKLDREWRQAQGAKKT